VSRSLNKEIISASCILLIIILCQTFHIHVCKAESIINTNLKTIVIDPGHGGEDTGITTLPGLSEKQCTLKLAKIIAVLLRNRYTVLLTRDRDLNLSCLKRTSFANINNADIFISLHTKKRETDPGSLIVCAPMEALKHSRQISPAPWEAEQIKQIKKSMDFAKIFAGEFSRRFSTDFIVTQAPVVVLQGAQMPALLMETFSMDELLGGTDQEIILQNHAEIIARVLENILK